MPTVRFLPSCLSKMDCPDHPSPPILVWCSLTTTSLSAPLPLWKDFEFRRSLGIAHNYLFSPSFFSPLSTGVFRVAALGLSAHQNRCASWLHVPHFCLRCLCSWCWRLRLFGGGRLDWRPYILSPLSLTFGLGLTSNYRDNRTVGSAEAEEQ